MACPSRPSFVTRQYQCRLRKCNSLSPRPFRKGKKSSRLRRYYNVFRGFFSSIFYKTWAWAWAWNFSSRRIRRCRKTISDVASLKGSISHLGEGIRKCPAAEQPLSTSDVTEDCPALGTPGKWSNDLDFSTPARYAIEDRVCNSIGDGSLSCVDNEEYVVLHTQESVHVRKPSSLRAIRQKEMAMLNSMRNSPDIVLQLPHGEGLSGHDILLLLHGRQLNSEVINTYLALLKMRSNMQPHLWPASGIPRAHIFNTFFYTKYKSSDYEGVSKWTKNINIFSFDLVLLPINHNNVHWSIVAVDFKSRQVKYYDSLRISDDGYYLSITRAVTKYLDEEATRKNDLSQIGHSWEHCIMDAPQQEDMTSCGIFLCAFADLILRGVDPPFHFLHGDIPHLQIGMAADILRGYIC